MGKQVPAENGIPAREFLEDLAEYYKRNHALYSDHTQEESQVKRAIAESQRTLTVRLKEGVNAYTCLTQDQAGVVKRQIDKMGEELISPQVSIDDKIPDLLCLIHSFRLHCQNCLNKDCNQRDPETK